MVTACAAVTGPSLTSHSLKDGPRQQALARLHDDYIGMGMNVAVRKHLCQCVWPNMAARERER